MRTHIIIHQINSTAVRARRTKQDWVTFLELDDADANWDAIEENIVLRFYFEGDFSEFVTPKIQGFASMPPAVRIGLGLDE